MPNISKYSEEFYNRHSPYIRVEWIHPTVFFSEVQAVPNFVHERWHHHFSSSVRSWVLVVTEAPSIATTSGQLRYISCIYYLFWLVVNLLFTYFKKHIIYIYIYIHTCACVYVLAYVICAYTFFDTYNMHLICLCVCAFALMLSSYAYIYLYTCFDRQLHAD